MALKVYNTRTQQVEEFRTLKEGLARMYVCGPSVYDRSHIGHARSYVFYDVVKRLLLARGYEVEHVQNFTDIEENIAERSKEAGLPPLEYASGLIDAFFDDMDALRILRATAYPRVSEHIQEIQRIIQDLLEQDVAYFVDCREHDVCDVYFDVSKDPGYGDMVGQSIEEIAASRVEERGHRRHPLDFALWKSKDDWGITWESPWGAGRPGWHIECTAMALKYLGPNFDLHGGGLDLVFPHHESEEAVGASFTGQPYCRYYVHNGFVTVDRAKMSKSKKNFVTVEDLRARHDPEALRLFLVSDHYRAPLNYSEDAIREAEARLARWKRAVAALRERAEGVEPARAPPQEIREAREAFRAALDDDLRLDRAVEAVDRAAASASTELATPEEAAAALAFFREVADVLGVLWDLETRWTAPA